MVSKGYAIESIEAEIAKCDILCVFCHRVKTAKDQRWYSAFIDWDNPNDWLKYVLTTPVNGT
jgi:wyosine [tRNA(Phe)-imidazoG37] synthetase (radical SAM superfamily)